MGELSFCWRWWKSLRPDGYGQVNDGGKIRTAHRFMYELLVGPIPEDRQIHHTCENRWCVNPKHMELVDRAEHTRSHHYGKAKNQARRERIARCLTVGIPQTQIALMEGISQPTVSRYARAIAGNPRPSWRKPEKVI